MRSSAKGLLVAAVMLVVVVAVVKRQAESQAYLPPGGQGFVLPAPPSLQMASDGAGHLFILDGRGGQIFLLKPTDSGGWHPVRVARITPSEPPVALGRPIPAWQVLGLDRPVGPPLPTAGR